MTPELPFYGFLYKRHLCLWVQRLETQSWQCQARQVRMSWKASLEAESRSKRALGCSLLEWFRVGLCPSSFLKGFISTPQRHPGVWKLHATPKVPSEWTRKCFRWVDPGTVLWTLRTRSAFIQLMFSFQTELGWVMAWDEVGGVGGERWKGYSCLIKHLSLVQHLVRLQKMLPRMESLCQGHAPCSASLRHRKIETKSREAERKQTPILSLECNDSTAFVA